MGVVSISNAEDTKDFSEAFGNSDSSVTMNYRDKREIYLKA